MSESKGIAAKLAAAIGEVERIGKDGTNAHFKYTYTSAEQVYRVIRGPLLNNGLVVIPSVEESTTQGQTTILKLHLRLIDTETGESIEAYWMGEGQDKGDKGPYKAATGGMKTWLKHLFLLPADDDPEAEVTPHTQRFEPRPVQNVQPKAMSELAQLVEEVGFSQEEREALRTWIRQNPEVHAATAVDLLKDGNKGAVMAGVEFEATVEA
jgi:hypothetical protein